MEKERLPFFVVDYRLESCMKVYLNRQSEEAVMRGTRRVYKAGRNQNLERSPANGVEIPVS